MSDFLQAFKEDEVIQDLIKTSDQLEKVFCLMERWSNGSEESLPLRDYVESVVMRDCYELIIERFERLVEDNDI